MSSDFRPDGFEAHTKKDGSECRLRFYDDGGNERTIILSRDQMLPLVSDLQSRIDKGSVRPISPHGMGIGTVFQLRSVQIGRSSDGGGTRMTLHIAVDDGVRTLPIELTPSDVRHLIQQLSQYL